MVEVDATVDVDDARRGVDAVNAVEGIHVDDESAGVLRVVAVGAAEAAGDDAASEVSRLGVVLLGDLLDFFVFYLKFHLLHLWHSSFVNSLNIELQYYHHDNHYIYCPLSVL